MACSINIISSQYTYVYMSIMLKPVYINTRLIIILYFSKDTLSFWA